MKPRSGGFALIESLIAVLILMLGILGAIGMQVRGLSAVNDASGRAEVCTAAEELIGLMWSAQVSKLPGYAWDGSGDAPAPYSDWYKALQKRIPGVAMTVAATAFNNGYQMDLSFTWRIPGNNNSPRQYAVTTFISAAE